MVFPNLCTFYLLLLRFFFRCHFSLDVNSLFPKKKNKGSKKKMDIDHLSKRSKKPHLPVRRLLPAIEAKADSVAAIPKSYPTEEQQTKRVKSETESSSVCVLKSLAVLQHEEQEEQQHVLSWDFKEFESKTNHVQEPLCKEPP